MASTWTTERLKQLVAWNGKVTAGSYAVVISEASLRSTEKLPSEGATGHDAGIKFGTVPAGTMVVVEDMSKPTVAGYSERVRVRLPGFSLSTKGAEPLSAPAAPFDFANPTTEVTGWISKVTKQGQLRLVNLPDMASAKVNGKTRMFQDLKAGDVCIIASQVRVRSEEILESMLEEGQPTDVAGCFLDELQSGTVVKVIKRSSGGAQATEAQRVYNMFSRVQIAYVSDGQAKTGWISEITQKNELRLMNDDDLNLCAKVYTWNVKGECILRNVPELGGAPPTTSKSVVSAGTWGAQALTQLLEWNGKVTVGDVAVVVTEASLRTAQKLPSEGATGEEAGVKLGMVPAGTMAIVVGKSPPTEAGYSERIMVKLPGFSLDDSELVAPSQPFDFYHPSTAVFGWVSKVTKNGQLRVIMAPEVKKQEFVMNSKTMTKPVQDLKKNDVCIVVSSASVRSTEALESTSTSKQKLKTVGVKLIDLPTGTVCRVLQRGGKKGSKEQKAYGTISRVKVAFPAIDGVEQGWVSDITGKNQLRLINDDSLNNLTSVYLWGADGTCKQVNIPPAPKK